MNAYLDSGATVKPYKEVIDVVKKYTEELWHNPSALYSPATRVKTDMENARKIVADFINSKPEEIFFTSGSTESNNWCIRGFDDINKTKRASIFTTPVEHKSILKAIKNPYLHSFVSYIKVDECGLVNIDALEKQLKKNKHDICLVSVMAANNEVGSINHLQRIAEVVHKYNGIFHTDATQLLPHYPINVEGLGIDLMSGSAHKLGGLKGTGFLYKREGIDLAPLIYGEQEYETRGGTENVIGIMAMAKAIELRKHYVEKGSLLIEVLRNQFIKSLENIGCKLIGSRCNRLPNNINIMLPEGCNGESMLYMLDMAGIYISTGSACNSHSIEPSHVLKAIGLTDQEANRCIRITLPDDFDYEIDEIIYEIEKNIRLLQSECDTMMQD